MNDRLPNVPLQRFGPPAGSRRIICDVPCRCRHAGRCSEDGLPNSGRARDHVAAPGRRTGRRAIVSARNTAMKEVDGQDERLLIARPAASAARPGCSRVCAVENASAETAAVIAFPETKFWRPSLPDRFDH